MACASSGIAATLLPKGMTAHSVFRIPIELHEDSSCAIGGRSGRASLMRKIVFIIWDEAFMVHRYGFEAVARMLRDLRKTEDKPFGGVTLLILGDLRQTLPVITKGNRASIIDACLTRSRQLWDNFQRITLVKNMRVMNSPVEDQEKLLKHSEFLIKLGNGELPVDTNGAVEIPEEFRHRALCHCGNER